VNALLLDFFLFVVVVVTMNSCFNSLMTVMFYIRQGNEHIFKDIRRKVASQSPFQDRDTTKSRTEMEKMMQSIEDLKNKQAEFEQALEQKEAEKMLIYQVL
jgi:hypothetical protein